MIFNRTIIGIQLALSTVFVVQSKPVETYEHKGALAPLLIPRNRGTDTPPRHLGPNGTIIQLDWTYKKNLSPEQITELDNLVKKYAKERALECEIVKIKTSIEQFEKEIVLKHEADKKKSEDN